jgi:alginate biosynthesis protein AlgX
MRFVAAILAALLPVSALAQDSSFGCSNYEFGTSLPVVEGAEGVFYRTFADLRLQHAMNDRVVDQMGRLAAALKDQGTTLVYVAIPPKSLAMPDLLPARSTDYGFDIAMGEAVYADILNRLALQDIAAPDVMTAMRAAPKDGERPLFGADFHWSSVGARLTAEAVGQVIKADPAYAELTPKTYVSSETGLKSAFSSMRLGLQAFCVDALPPVQTMTWETVETAGEGVLDIGLGTPAEGETVDIFGTAGGAAGPDIVLVGTSFSDSDENNFAGFLQEKTGLEVVNYAITGGNQFGAITSYMTSREFQEARPTFLIWENPVYNNLAAFGPAPMEELIAMALAGSGCDAPLETTVSDMTLSASFNRDLTPTDMLSVDFGSDGPRSAEIKLTTREGITRSAKIDRGDRLRATGRFEFWLEPYWMPGLARIDVTFDRAPGAGSALAVCQTDKGDNL